MSEQRRYEIGMIAGELERIVTRLSDLADEEQAAFDSRPAGSKHSVHGFDSKDSYEEIEDAANTISLMAVKLREIATPRP